MNSESVFLLPLFFQAVAILVDEFHFHRKRGLPLWERISHPIDTVILLGCLSFTFLVPFSESNLKLYVCLAIISCIFVTKDEFVHQSQCTGGEIWLHSVLFLIHPMVLGSIGYLWHRQSPLLFWAAPGMILFLIYQIAFGLIFYPHILSLEKAK